MTTNSKEWIQYSTAALMVVSGVCLSFISFFTKGDTTTVTAFRQPLL